VNDALKLVGRLSPRAGWSAEGCTIARALDIVSTRSAMLLMREAFWGTTRFGDFAARVGISEPVAAARLQELVGHGLLEKAAYQEEGQRTRYEYRLTDMGAELLPTLVALMQWGDRWLAPDGPPVAVRHCGCGEPVHAELRCAAGHRTRTQDLELTAVDRPGRRSVAAEGAGSETPGGPKSTDTVRR
jgi:DNA-binding HxlR family transcriptional regulator